MTSELYALVNLFHELQRYHFTTLHHLSKVYAWAVAVADTKTAVCCYTSFTFHHAAYCIHHPQAYRLVAAAPQDECKVGGAWVRQGTHL
jgi:hypothetical protein